MREVSPPSIESRRKLGDVIQNTTLIIGGSNVEMRRADDVFAPPQSGA